MSAIINGDSPSVTFSDGTTQSTAFTTTPVINNIKSQAATPLTFAINTAEAMRIDASGNLLLGATAAYSGTPRMFIKNIAGNANNTILQMQCQSTSIANTMLNFYDGNNTFMGQIYVNPGLANTVYATSSDYRLKENAKPVTGAKDFILALQPKTWIWKHSGLKSTGFIAHEVQEIAKESVLGTKDEVDADGNPVYQSMQAGSSEIIANLVSFVQEQQAIIEELKAKVTALETK